MSLYHKYRPATIADVKGNKHITAALETMLSNPEKMPRAFMFTGESGCGKTTFARIIKNTLGVSDYDFSEVNSSEMRGIDTARDIIKNAQYMPVESPYRVFLLDEFHKTTNDAQNALLKLLEDTPAHVILILATTDPQKVIKAVKNRCQTFEVQPLTEREMRLLLKTVCRGENVEIAPEVVTAIVTAATGFPRLALQLLDQVLSVDESKQLAAAKKVEAETTESIALCRALVGNGDWSQVRTILEGLKQTDAESIRRHVLGYATAVLLKSENNKAALVLEQFLEPTYNSGFSQIVFACYSVTNG